MGQIRNRMLALSRLVQSQIAGAPVWAYEPVNYPAPITEPLPDIDDAHNVYGDAPKLAPNVIPLHPDIHDLFPDAYTPCIASPHGQCQYDALAGDEHDCCIYCGRRTG